MYFQHFTNGRRRRGMYRVREWIQQPVQSSLSGKSETVSICRHSSLYSRHSLVRQRLETFEGTAVCIVVTLG
ncbi:hypothetical protein DPMN_040196 [Dreissena polymorpha]|uniref:Uncharacterized protein n=1 Tax=Dreissena polymorpha TaxID=45954 RepID=A0A9D4HUS6_DREPO|nr:hypothetical protein DPMN_040196 [Dreissena polymorpha]